MKGDKMSKTTQGKQNATKSGADLVAEQRARLFEKECEILEFRTDESVIEKIKRLENLAHGDFAAVKRLAKFSPLKNANDFYERLCEEVKIKDLQGTNSKAGFSV